MINIAPNLYAELKRALDPAPNPYSSNATAFGIPIATSNAFPHEWDCKGCDGSGEGDESTYCPKCSGAGRVRALGYMTAGFGQPATLIVDKLPKAFAPYFPAGIVLPPPISRGLP